MILSVAGQCMNLGGTSAVEKAMYGKTKTRWQMLNKSQGNKKHSTVFLQTNHIYMQIEGK